MTADSSPDLVLRKRYRVAAGQTVPVAIQRSAKERQPASGTLVDISASGARFQSDAPLEFGEKLILHLEVEPIDVSVSIVCKVRWIRGGNSGDQWTVGCLFDYHLEQTILEEYVEDGLLERRQSDRYDISLTAAIKFEGIEDEIPEVDLYNIGTGGFCFQSPIAGTIGSRVRMNPEDSAHSAVEGRIMWQSEVDGEILVGCRWINRKGIFFAQKLLDASALKPTRSRSILGNHLVGTLMIAVVAFFLGVLTTSVAFSVSEPTTASADDWFTVQ